jgi:hypothetical protein
MKQAASEHTSHGAEASERLAVGLNGGSLLFLRLASVAAGFCSPLRRFSFKQSIAGSFKQSIAGDRGHRRSRMAVPTAGSSGTANTAIAVDEDGSQLVAAANQREKEAPHWSQRADSRALSCRSEASLLIETFTDAQPR